MAEFKVGGITFASLDSSVGDDGPESGQFWRGNPRVIEGVFDRRRISIPGINQFRVKKFGSRGRMISQDVIYIDDSPASVYDTMAGDRESLENTEFKVTPPFHGEFLSCELAAFPEGEVLQVVGAKFCMITSITLYSLD